MGRKKVKVWFVVVAVALLVSFAHVAAAAAPDVGFYKGKVINYIVSTKPGGGYDTYARLIAKYMQKYIPGSTVIVKNLPGAGHIIGANETYLAKPDGLTIGTFNTGLIYSQIVGFPGIRFDMAKYDWIGKASSETRVLVVGIKSPYMTFQDILNSKEPIKMAASGVGTAANNDGLIVAAATGANFKMIPGYPGREGEMAMMRGEVVGQVGSYVGLTGFIKAKECRVLLQIAVKKHKDLKDVPLASEMKFSAKGKKILAVINSVAELGRLTAATPKTPPARLQVLRDAYKKALTDPDLLRDAKKMDLEIDPGFGEEVAKLVKEAINQPPDNMEVLKKTIKVEN
jgi:tripartite-type tricarboxylate transporter receptor subunit TctC